MTIPSGSSAGFQPSSSPDSSEQPAATESTQGADAATYATGDRPDPAITGRPQAARATRGGADRSHERPHGPPAQESVNRDPWHGPRWNPEGAAEPADAAAWPSLAVAHESAAAMGPYAQSGAGSDPRYRAGVRRCKSCDTYAYATTGICPECGDDLQAQPRVIRCRRCGQQANSELVICPHCARTLVAAPSRVWTMGAPAALALLFALVLVGQLGGFSGLTGRSSVMTVSGQSELVRMTPVPAEAMQAAPAQAESGTVDALAADGETTVNDSANVAESEAGLDTVAETVAETVPETVADTAPETGADDTGLAQDAESAETGDSPAAAALAAASEELDTVAQAETESRGIGGLVGMRQLAETEDAGDGAEDNDATNSAVDEPVASAAGASPDSAVAATDEEMDDEASEESEVRAATMIVPTPTPAPSEPQLLEYEVQPGDTIIGIAVRHSTTVESILSLNNMSEQDAQRMRPGLVLRVPTETEAGGADVMAASVTRASEDYRLAAPVLRSPSDGSVLDCAARERLTWLAVPYMETSDNYVLHLGFVAGRNDDGSEQITWVLAQPRPANMTSWELDSALCSLAPVEYGRQWRWWVETTQTVEGQTEAASPPSAVWTFVWN